MMEKEKALEMALSQIEKQFGKGAVMKLGDAAAKIVIVDRRKVVKNQGRRMNQFRRARKRQGGFQIIRGQFISG